MKKLTLALMAAVAMFAGTNVFAQGKWGADSAECIKYMSYYKEYFKQKSYDEALPNWRKAYSLCPASASQNLLIDGTTLMRRVIAKNASNAEYKAALVDTLITLHSQRAENYPKYKTTALNNMGVDVSNFLKNSPAKQYEAYEKIISELQGETKNSILLFDLQSAIDLYQAGSLDAETVIKAYQRNVALLEGAKAATEEDAAKNNEVKNDMGSLFAASKVASCDNLIELFTPRYEADPENLQLATNIVQTMSLTEDCNNNDLFLKAVTTMNKLDPSASSSYYLYKLHGARGNSSEAVKYLEDALARDDMDPAKKAEWTYELAAFCYKNGMNAKAFEVASKVASSYPDYEGKAYFLIGNIWGGTRCGDNEISRRAPMWVACDYMNKAKAADPSLTEEANRYIGQYSAYFPSTQDAFMYDISNGQSYTVSCGGMRATTTVRTVKR